MKSVLVGARRLAHPETLTEDEIARMAKEITDDFERELSEQSLPWLNILVQELGPMEKLLQCC